MLNEIQNRKEYIKTLLEAGKVNLRRQGRVAIAKLKINHGKVIRNKKVSAVRGYEFSHKKLKKMSTQERLHRKLATRRARFKIKAKLSSSRRKWHASMRKRRALGG